MNNDFGLNDYQTSASSLAIYPGQGDLMGIMYCTLKLTGEAGEVSEKIGKVLRDKNGVIDDETRLLLVKELGDVMWYIANLAKELGWDLADVANTNLEKLNSRRERGVLQGSGDNR